MNEHLEEAITRPVSGLERVTALEVGVTLVYAINGAIGRLEGWREFTGDME